MQYWTLAPGMSRGFGRWGIKTGVWVCIPHTGGGGGNFARGQFRRG